ncbi:hypothetical protein, partial [Escherichia coli]|uniref:hypothetical protein n=1 Tax=Escherichia coli TaxID=562 RepID=UPI00226E91A5
MNGGVINTLRLVNHHRKPAFGSKLYSPDTIIVTSNAILAVQQFYLFIFCESGFAPIFPDTCYHLTHYWPAAADIPV